MSKRKSHLSRADQQKIISGVVAKKPKTPSKLVEAIISEMQKLRSQPNWVIDSWADVQEIYEQIQKKTSGLLATQSWRAASGQGFQKFSQDYLNSQLNGVGIAAVSKSFIEEKANYLVPLVSLSLNRQCVQRSETVWQDSDIAIVTMNGQQFWKLIAIASCKTSFHARETEACFYALARQQRNIKQVLLTVDADNDMATCQKPNKVRILFESYFERVYSTNPNTKICAIINHFEADQNKILVDDIIAWRRQVVPNYSSTPIARGSVY